MAETYPTIANSFTGKLLVATPQLQHSPFSETVVYISRHTSHGARGYVLNRPSYATVGKLLHTLELPASVYHDDKLWMGGPLGERDVHLLHTADWYSASTAHVNTQFAVSCDEFMLEKLAMNDTPTEWMMFVGYSGWAPGQLEKEIANNDWLTIPANPAIVFSSKKDQLWTTAIELCGQQMIETFF